MNAIAAIVGQARALLSITIAMLTVSAIAMITRLVVRARRAKVSFVDYFMLLAEVCLFLAQRVHALLTCQAIFVATCALYLKASGWEILGAAAETKSELAQSAQLTTSIKIATVLYAFTVTTARGAVATWLPNLAKWQRYMVKITIFIATALAFTHAAMLLFPCAASESKGDTCNPTRLSALFTLIWSFFNAFVSLGLGGVAISSLVKDNSLHKAKILGTMILLLGSTSTLAAIARCILILGVVSDIQVQRIIIGELAVLEAGLLITAGCLATLRPMFGRALGYVRDEQLDYQSAPGLERLRDDGNEDDYDQANDYDDGDMTEKGWADIDEKYSPTPAARQTNVAPPKSSTRTSFSLGGSRRRSSTGVRLEFSRMRSRAAQKAKSRRQGMCVQQQQQERSVGPKDMTDVDLNVFFPDSQSQDVVEQQQQVSSRPSMDKQRQHSRNNNNGKPNHLVLGGRNLSISSRINSARKQFARGAAMSDPRSTCRAEDEGFRSLLADPVRA